MILAHIPAFVGLSLSAIDYESALRSVFIKKKIGDQIVCPFTVRPHPNPSPKEKDTL